MKFQEGEMETVSRVKVVFVRALVCVLSLAAAVNQWGCVSTRPLVVARSVDIAGPIHQVPVRVTDGNIKGQLRLTPHIEFSREKDLEGTTGLNNDINLEQYGNYDSTNNVNWTLPSYVAGLSLDYGLSEAVSLSAGATYSDMNGRESYEWDGGLAVCFQDRNIGGRLEAGVQWQDIRYDVFLDRYDLIGGWSTRGSTSRYLYSIRRYGKFLTANFYCDFVLNTKVKSSPVNGFVRAGYGVTSILSNDMLRVSEDGDIATSVGFFSLTPGLFFDLTKWNRLVLGCDFINPAGMTGPKPRWLIMPLVQIDFTI